MKGFLYLSFDKIKINAPLSLVGQKIITTQMLQQIVAISQTMDNPLLFRTLYLFTFFSFLRLSNILPHSVQKFDPTRHLTRGDIIFSEKFCTVIVKWTKTLQNCNQMATITIPSLGESPLCPVKALTDMFQELPADKKSPLFCIIKKSTLLPLTDSTARKYLKHISSILAISPTLTFHMFRKSATTWAFDKGVPLQDIMQHGTWSSSAVWRYICYSQSVKPVITRNDRKFQSFRVMTEMTSHYV